MSSYRPWLPLSEGAWFGNSFVLLPVTSNANIDAWFFARECGDIEANMGFAPQLQMDGLFAIYIVEDNAHKCMFPAR